MAVGLAYVDAAPGRLYPLVATLLALAQRGHRRLGALRGQRRRAAALARSPTNPVVTGKIALAHLNEFPDYYTRLARMEEEARREAQAR